MESPEQTLLMEFVGVKVWIFKGEKFERETNDNNNSDKVPNDELKKVDS